MKRYASLAILAIFAGSYALASHENNVFQVKKYSNIVISNDVLSPRQSTMPPSYILAENAIGACFFGLLALVCRDNMLESECSKLANSQFLGQGSTCKEYDL